MLELMKDVEKYIALHQTMGFKFKQQSYQLRNFAIFATERGESMVTSQSAVDWAKEAPSPCSRTERLRFVRRFATSMAAENPIYEIPPKINFGQVQRRQPHIFTAKEISQILNAAWALNPKDSIRPRTYVTLFALLAATGLRISEALALEFDDVTENGLVIRKTKFRKSRLIPLHITVKNALNRYLEVRIKVPGSSPSVFVSLEGKRIAYSTVVCNFLQIVRQHGVHPGVGQSGPRIHDFRHTFAVRSLEDCPRDRGKIRRHIHALSTYLGHAHVTDTYWYLQATPHLLRNISESAEAFAPRGKT